MRTKNKASIPVDWEKEFKLMIEEFTEEVDMTDEWGMLVKIYYNDLVGIFSKLIDKAYERGLNETLKAAEAIAGIVEVNLDEKEIRQDEREKVIEEIKSIIAWADIRDREGRDGQVIRAEIYQKLDQLKSQQAI